MAEFDDYRACESALSSFVAVTSNLKISITNSNKKTCHLSLNGVVSGGFASLKDGGLMNSQEIFSFSFS